VFFGAWQRNLAVALEVEPGTTNVELKLEPGLTLVGRRE